MGYSSLPRGSIDLAVSTCLPAGTDVEVICPRAGACVNGADAPRLGMVGTLPISRRSLTQGVRERTPASCRCAILTEQAARLDRRRHLVACIRAERRSCIACVIIRASRVPLDFSWQDQSAPRRPRIPRPVKVRRRGGAITLRPRARDPEIASSVLGRDENGGGGQVQTVQNRLAACR